MDFVSELVRKRGKENLQKFIRFIVEIFRRYDEASIEYKPYRQKDGALLAIGALCDKLKQTEPYKSELERMLVQHVFPEFNSPVGHLRAKKHSQLLDFARCGCHLTMSMMRRAQIHFEISHQ